MTRPSIQWRLRELVQYLLDDTRVKSQGDERLAMMALFLAAAALARANNVGRKTFFEGVEMAWKEIQEAKKIISPAPAEEAPSVH